MGFLSALQAGDHAKGDYFSGTMQARLPSAKLGQVWEQLTSAYGQLNSFAVTARSEVNGELLRIVSLNFESGAGGITARIALDPLDKIAGLYFVPAKSSMVDSQIADQRANDLVRRSKSRTSSESRIFQCGDEEGTATAGEHLARTQHRHTVPFSYSFIDDKVAYRLVNRSETNWT